MEFVGTWTQISLYWLFGTGAYLAPLVCAFYVYALLNPKDNEEVSMSKVTGIGLLFISLLGIMELSVVDWGGMVGVALLWPLSYLFGTTVAGVILGGLVLISGFLILNTGLRLPRLKAQTPLDDEDIDNLLLPETSEEDEAEFAEEVEEADKEATKTAKRPAIQKVSDKLGLTSPAKADFVVSTFSGTYAPPSLSLLKKDAGKPQTGDVKTNANIMKRTLKEFGIHVEMDAVEIGPTSVAMH